MKNKTITITIGKEVIRGEIFSTPKDIGYSIHRNDKTIKVSSYPKKMESQVLMDVVQDLQESLFYEIRHALTSNEKN